MAYHGRQMPVDGIHVVQAFEYANAAARVAATGLTPSDIGKVARQLDDESFYVLIDDSPVTWKSISLDLTNNPPAPLGFPAFAGTSDKAAREDHVHIHGTVAGGTTHPDAVAGSPGTSGYISGVSQQKLNDLVEVKDESVSLGVGKKRINFLGSGVVAAVDGGDPDQINVTIPGSGTATITVKDEGVALTPDKNKLNFTGAAVTATTDGGDPSQANVNIDAPPTTRNLTAGAGMTGGGDLSADRTFDVAANADGSIVVNPNDIQVGVLATDGQHGVRGGGTQHALVVPAGAAGFMSGADKTKLDGVATGATNTPLTSTAPVDVTKAAAVVGVSTEAARADHKHDAATAAAANVGDTNAEGASTSLSRADHIHHAMFPCHIFGTGSIAATTTTRYLTPGYDSAAAPTTAIQYRVPSTGTLRRLRVHINGPAGNGNAVVYTVRVNGVATALTCSAASTAADGSDLVNSVAVTAGDLIDIEVTKAASIGAAISDVVASLEVFV